MATMVRRDTAASTHTVTGGHLVARALKAEGIEAIFTLCGGDIIDIFDGCPHPRIRIIDVRPEQAPPPPADALTPPTRAPPLGPGTPRPAPPPPPPPLD